MFKKIELPINIIIKLYKSGTSVLDLSKKCNVSLRYMYKILSVKNNLKKGYKIVDEKN